MKKLAFSVFCLCLLVSGCSCYSRLSVKSEPKVPEQVTVANVSVIAGGEPVTINGTKFFVSWCLYGDKDQATVRFFDDAVADERLSTVEKREKLCTKLLLKHECIKSIRVKNRSEYIMTIAPEDWVKHRDCILVTFLE